MQKYEVLVELKKEVLDPQGRAIQETMVRLGFEPLKSVQVSKRFILDFDDSCDDAEKMASRIADEHLANPVAETFQIRKL